jgi:tetratricopeptide (TPR) repeat protein
MTWLSGKDHWLLIIDNADDPKLDISGFFPRGSKGSILITTRNPDFQKYATAGSSFKVNEMRVEDAVALLLKTAAVENVRDQEERDAATAVVKVLGYFALAIIQAGAVIRQGLCSLLGFCELYAKQKKELLESGRAEPSIDYQYSVYTTWEISIRMIEAVPDTYAKLALELLRLFAFMHFDSIKEEIFEKAHLNRDLHDDPRDGSIYHATETARIMEAGWDTVLFRRAVGVLVAFSLVSVDKSERISMHPLVHEWSKARMTDTQQKQGWKTAAATLAGSIPFYYTSSDEAHRRYLLPHISASLNECMSLLFEDGPDLQGHLKMAEKFALAYRENLRNQEALDLELEVLKWSQTVFQSEYPNLLITKSVIASLYAALGRPQKALEISESVLELLERTMEKDSRPILEMMCRVADCSLCMGRSEIAIEKAQQAYGACKRVLGNECALTMMALNIVSKAYMLKGEWEEAARAGETALGYLKLELQWTACNLETMRTVAYAYGMLKQCEKSRRMYLTCVEILDSSHGKESKEAALVMANFTNFESAIRDSIWKKKEGVLLRREALRRMEAAFGKTDLRTLQCMGCLAESYFLRGLLRNARRIQEDQVNNLINYFGENNPETIVAKENLAKTRMWIAIREALYWWLPKRSYLDTFTSLV